MCSRSRSRVLCSEFIWLCAPVALSVMRYYDIIVSDICRVFEQELLHHHTDVMLEAAYRTWLIDPFIAQSLYTRKVALADDECIWDK